MHILQLSGYKWRVGIMQYDSVVSSRVFPSIYRSVFPSRTSHPFGNTLNVNAANKLTSYLVSTHCCLASRQYLTSERSYKGYHRWSREKWRGWLQVLLTLSSVWVWQDSLYPNNTKEGFFCAAYHMLADVPHNGLELVAFCQCLHFI